MSLPISDADHSFWNYAVKKSPTGLDFKCKFCSKEYNDFTSKRCVLSHVKHLAKVESNDTDNCHPVPKVVQKRMQLVFEHLEPNLEELLKKDAIPLEIRKELLPASSKSRTVSKYNSFMALLDSGVVADAMKLNYDKDNQNTETNKFWEYAVKTPTGFTCMSCSKDYSKINKASAMMHIEHLAKLECDDEDVQNLQQLVSELNLNMEGMNNDNINDDACLKMRNKQAEWELKLNAKFDRLVALLRALHQPIA